MNIKTDIIEALRYLGCKTYDSELADTAKQCINEINSIMTPRWTYRVYSVCPDNCGVKIIDNDYYIKSCDIQKLLKNSDKCVIMAATLGTEVDKKIAYYQKIDMSKAVIFDACASATVEALCDYAQQQIKSIENVKFLTMRYSPGYGDFDIEEQKKVLELTDAYRKIGLTTNSSYVLTPLKSVTAVMGITDEPYMICYNSCNNCSKNKTCAFKG